MSGRYAKKGQTFGTLVAFGWILIYLVSPDNPNRGHLLSLEQMAILAATFFGCTLVGTGIGYCVGKIADSARTLSPKVGPQPVGYGLGRIVGRIRKLVRGLFPSN